MREASAERAAQPGRIVRNVPDHAAQQPTGGSGRSRAMKGGVAHARSDRQGIAIHRKPVEARNRIDVDEMRRPRHTERHHRHETLTAAQNPALKRRELGEHRQDFVRARRRVIGKRGGLHRINSLAFSEAYPEAAMLGTMLRRSQRAAAREQAAQRGQMMPVQVLP
jgi:hypothetical protein